MTTYETVMKMIKAMGNDADFEIKDNIIYVTIHDFEGFADDWSEVMREYENPEAVEAFEDLINECMIDDDDLYHFNGFAVDVYYDSYDI